MLLFLGFLKQDWSDNPRQRKESLWVHKYLFMSSEWQPLTQNPAPSQLHTAAKEVALVPGRGDAGRTTEAHGQGGLEAGESSPWLTCCFLVLKQCITFFGSKEVKWFYFWFAGVANWRIDGVYIVLPFILSETQQWHLFMCILQTAKQASNSCSPSGTVPTPWPTPGNLILVLGSRGDLNLPFHSLPPCKCFHWVRKGK